MTDPERNDAVRAALRRLDAKLPGEKDHAERVAVYAVATGYELGLRGRALLTLRVAAELHDIGKLLVDGVAPEAQSAERKTHVLYAHSQTPSLDVDVRRIIRLHHERIDGSGYPFGLRGDRIPLESQIIGLAEHYDHVAWRLDQGEEAGRTAIQSPCFSRAVAEAFLSIEPLIQPVGR